MTLQDPAQAKPGPGTLTNLFVVAAGKTSVVSSVFACNQGSSPARWRMAVAPTGATDAAEHYIVWDRPIPANTTDTWTSGITLGALSVLRVYSNTGAVSFNACRDEV